MTYDTVMSYCHVNDMTHTLEFDVCPTLCALWAYVLVRYLDIEVENKTQNGFDAAILGDIISRNSQIRLNGPKWTAREDQSMNF